MKKILKVLLIILVIILVILGAVLGFAYFTEYRPKEIEKAEFKNVVNKDLEIGKEYKALTFNTGYAGLDKEEDFLLDGGKTALPIDRKHVETNLEGIKKIIEREDADITLLQEVDRDSKRTYNIDQVEYFTKSRDINSTYTTFFRSPFIPYPLKEMMGKMEAGQLTMTKFDIDSSIRIDLPPAFSFPVRAFQSKRALQRNEFSIKNSDKKLILYNIHLEAYDKNNTRQKQLEILTDRIEKDYADGNYVIVGGDFNQRFEEANNAKYPVLYEEYFVAPIVKKDVLSDNFRFVFSDKTPTARLLNEPYTGDLTKKQVYVIDGYIFSNNIEVNSVEVVNQNFEYSDHNPVAVKFKLK